MALWERLLVVGGVLLVTVVVFANLLADIAYGIADPRIGHA